MSLFGDLWVHLILHPSPSDDNVHPLPLVAPARPFMVSILWDIKFYVQLFFSLSLFCLKEVASEGSRTDIRLLLLPRLLVVLTYFSVFYFLKYYNGKCAIILYLFLLLKINTSTLVICDRMLATRNLPSKQPFKNRDLCRTFFFLYLKLFFLMHFRPCAVNKSYMLSQ